MRTHAYIDASNLFYGGKKSLGWSVDYKKLYKYLEEKYGVEEVYFFGGVEIYKFPFNYLTYKSVPLKDLIKYLIKLVDKKEGILNEIELRLLSNHLKRVRFYLAIEKIGYKMILKPVKTFFDSKGLSSRKANCDVDMTFFLMRDRKTYDRAVILSGDGDFLPVLKFLREEDKKEIFILAHASRTAKEIKRFAAEKFLDFTYLRERLKQTEEGL